MNKAYALKPINRRLFDFCIDNCIFDMQAYCKYLADTICLQVDAQYDIITFIRIERGAKYFREVRYG